MEIAIRKRALYIEEILHEGGPPPATRCAAAPRWR